MRRRLLVIIGGMGPFASARLNLNIIQSHSGLYDQSYPNIIHVSMPEWIPDRTEYLLKGTVVNPGEVCFDLLRKTLKGFEEDFDKIIVVIPCFTFHSKEIMNVFERRCSSLGVNIEIINMVDITVAYLKSLSSEPLVVWSTKGSYKSNVWTSKLREAGVSMVEHDEAIIKISHNIIYNERYGLKAYPVGNNRTDKEIYSLLGFSKFRGAKKVLLGCTELSAYFTQRKDAVWEGVDVIDPFSCLISELKKLGYTDT